MPVSGRLLPLAKPRKLKFKFKRTTGNGGTPSRTVADQASSTLDTDQSLQNQVPTDPHTIQSAPFSDPLAPSPGPAAPYPDSSTPSPAPSEPHPDPSAPYPDSSTPSPAPSEPHPDPSAPSPAPSEPHPDPSAPYPDSSASSPSPAEPHPAPSALYPDPSAPSLGPSEPHPSALSLSTIAPQNAQAASSIARGPEPLDTHEIAVCTMHNERLELFCKTEQVYMCKLCPTSNHRLHNIVHLNKECDAKKAEMRRTMVKIQQMIEQRQLNIADIKQAARLDKDAGDKEIMHGVEIFNEVIKMAVEGREALIQKILEKKIQAGEQAENTVTELQQETSNLTGTYAVLQQLISSEDHLQVHRGYEGLDVVLPTTNRRNVDTKPIWDGMAKRALAELSQRFPQAIENGMTAGDMKWAQQYDVDVTLDSNTANPWLILSNDGKQLSISLGDVCEDLPPNPDRFEPTLSVLGNPGFSSGRFYFEVQVEGKIEWDLGVAKESVKRKGPTILNPENGFWTICLRNTNEYFSHAGPAVPIQVNGECKRVGVYADYEEGFVSFYNIDAAARLYSFTGCPFTDRLFPYLSPGLPLDGANFTPMIIAPVSFRVPQNE